MFVAFPVLWFSILIAVCFIAIGIGCTIAELQGTLQIRQLVRNVGACLKYEVVELPFPAQEGALLPVASPARYRKMKTFADQYTCPQCGCPSTCEPGYRLLDPDVKHPPRLYTYHCVSGHCYLLRFQYDTIWERYKWKEYFAYVCVSSRSC